MMWSAPTVERFGPYRLSRLLGRGGMAEVWSGVEPSRAIALKRILPHLCDDFDIVDMFISEARLAKLLHHPNIVGTYDAGIIDRRPFIAMELVEGIDLRRLCFGTPEPLPIGFCVAVVAEVCGALDYVHSLRDRDGRPMGLIHRDISHSNIMLTRAGGTVKLLDFGVAKARMTAGLSRTQAGELKGKLGYMAPELVRGQPYDHRADLFSIGVVLHELLSRRRLFVADNEVTMLLKNLGCEVTAPSLTRPEVPPVLDAIVLRALNIDPARRYPTAAEMLRDLIALATDFPWTRPHTVALLRDRASQVTDAATPTVRMASGPTLPGRPNVPTARWTRRHQRALMAAAIAFALIAGTALAPKPLPPTTRIAPPPPPATAPAPQIAIPDPWASPPRDNILSSHELAIRLPALPPTPAPSAPVRHAPKHHRTTAHKLLSHDQLINPLAQ